jgi:L-fucose isomerase
MGNDLPTTSSIVGVLGAGGALDQVGLPHSRVIDHADPVNRRKVLAFVRAASAIDALRGQTLGLFGGRSLGILTTVADPVQWLRLFGVDIEYADQLEIQLLAEQYPAEAVQAQVEWLKTKLGSVEYSGTFTSLAFERQVRSYLAVSQLAESRGFDFVGVKCQPELSDGYVTQCVAHMLFNGELDALGHKPLRVHACESDADGALTMQILHLLSGGKSAALLDVRWFDRTRGLWTLANCGAMPASFFATPGDASGLSGLHLREHAFGLGGGGALAGVVAPQPVSLARLCRKNGQYWMAILSGEVVPPREEDLQRITPAFPKAFVRTAAGEQFLQEFGSNHIHMVAGDVMEELLAFCRLSGIEARVW